MDHESEKTTRKKRIDKKLQESGWSIIPYSEQLNKYNLASHAVEEYPTLSGPADYALFVKGRLLGFVEAKKISVAAENVLEQAKRYSQTVLSSEHHWRDYRVPFLYSSNGENIYHVDVRDELNISREIAKFHTPDALEEFINDTKRYNGYEWLNNHSITDIERLRPYQVKAIASIEKALSERKRKMLVAMATGTGKTFTTVSLAYRLLKSGVARRILFLVDRKALAAQATVAFSSFNTLDGHKFNQEYPLYSQRFKKEDFEEGEKFDTKVLPNEYLTKPTSIHTFVYVCTIQRMTRNLLGIDTFASDYGEREEIEDDTLKLDIPVHAFDVVIADECHRGYTSRDENIWREVLRHFDAVKIGLTATPASHTVGYFGEPVYKYSTSEGINEGWLVDYEAVKISSNVRINGTFLKEGEEVEIVNTETGDKKRDSLEDEREYASTDIENKISVPDSNRKIISEIKEYALKHEQETGVFPKTLIFAVNDISHISHSDELVRICKETFGRGDDFVKKITGNPNVDRPLQKIREFRNRPEPKIVVTVDMLSTGVDIPCLEYIVFLRPVKSRILWEQMLGRGTRRCPEINKSHFTIFDCFDGTLIDYFKNATSFDITLQSEIIPIKEVIENIYQNKERDYYTKVLIRRLRRIEKEMSGDAFEKFAAYIPEGHIGKFADNLQANLKTDFLGTMKTLRDEGFQELLIKYPRAKREFIKAVEAKDTVSSEYVFRVGDKTLKPQDYLKEFSLFVMKNHIHIHALEILLDKPKGWNSDALKELRNKLRENRFSEQELQKAHGLVYHKALADIISMVKHAAKEEEALLTAEERVKKAISKAVKGLTLTEEQNQWMGLIREHLVKNLAIEVEDFKIFPIFERQGGLKRAQKIFSARFKDLIEEINLNMAA